MICERKKTSFPSVVARRCGKPWGRYFWRIVHGEHPRISAASAMVSGSPRGSWRALTRSCEVISDLFINFDFRGCRVRNGNNAGAWEVVWFFKVLQEGKLSIRVLVKRVTRVGVGGWMGSVPFPALSIGATTSDLKRGLSL